MKARRRKKQKVEKIDTLVHAQTWLEPRTGDVISLHYKIQEGNGSKPPRPPVYQLKVGSRFRVQISGPAVGQDSQVAFAILAKIAEEIAADRISAADRSSLYDMRDKLVKDKQAFTVVVGVADETLPKGTSQQVDTAAVGIAEKSLPADTEVSEYQSDGTHDSEEGEEEEANSQED